MDDFLFFEDEPTGPTDGVLMVLTEATRGACLVSQDGQIYDIVESVTCIGRSPYRKINVDDGEVSRKHAEIVREAGRHFVRDMKAPNGTFVNGVRIVDQVPLWDGDRIQLGHTQFTFSRGDVGPDLISLD